MTNKPSEGESKECRIRVDTRHSWPGKTFIELVFEGTFKVSEGDLSTFSSAHDLVPCCDFTDALGLNEAEAELFNSAVSYEEEVEVIRCAVKRALDGR